MRSVEGYSPSSSPAKLYTTRSGDAVAAAAVVLQARAVRTAARKATDRAAFRIPQPPLVPGGRPPEGPNIASRQPPAANCTDFPGNPCSSARKIPEFPGNPGFSNSAWADRASAPAALGESRRLDAPAGDALGRDPHPGGV